MKKPSVYRQPRSPNIRYLVSRLASGSSYRLTRKFNTGKFEYSQVLPYMHLPPWMRDGMKMLDITYEPNARLGKIPGFGERSEHTYIFYAEAPTT